MLINAGVWWPADPANLHVRRWDREWLVFYEPSGETHLLGALAVALLQRLQAGGCAESVLVREALETLASSADPELDALASRTLAHLLDIGLARYSAQ